jgi:murein DD-endopeptidase MepM/ murein hydrolase activator NlpD
MVAKHWQSIAVIVIVFLAIFVAMPGFISVAGANTLSFVPITFPVAGENSFEDTFGEPRDGGARTHEGIDIIAAKMTQIVAVVDGTIDWLNDGIETSTANGLPYYNLMLRGDDGNDYYYIHINNDTPGTDDGMGGPANAYAPGIADEVHVNAGQPIAYVGDSGNAEDVASHLHFEIHLGGYKNPINPYMSLVIAKNGSPFRDVEPGNWCLQYLMDLAGESIIGGYADGTFRPSTNVTRGEFVKMVAAAAGMKSATSFNKSFEDITESCWAWPYIAAVKDAGIVDGDMKGNFNPDDYLIRAEAAKIAVKACKMSESTSSAAFNDVAQDYWAFSSIMTAKSTGLIDGYVDGNYRPYVSITRAEAAKIVDGIFKQCNRQ